METSLVMTIYYIKAFITNMCVYYCFEKFSNNRENHLKNNIILAIVNIILVYLYMIIKSNSNTFLPFIVMSFIYTIIISKLTKKELGYTLGMVIVSYAVVAIFQGISVVIQFIPYKILEKLWSFDNLYVSLILITIVQLTLLNIFFRMKKLKNGFSFLNNKLSNDVINIMMINISVIVIIIYCLFIIYNDEIAMNLFITFFMLAVMMIFTIKKMFTMYYKQKLLADTMEEYKSELVEKQKEIDKLKEEKKNVSKITHEFYNRQKALELLVGSNMEVGVINKEGVSQSVLKMIDSLTNEYSQRFESVKDLPKLETTDIPELDNMFKYMQSECHKNNIEFKLKIIGNIHTLVNNIIPKNKLETLIGDHLRDAINAVNMSNKENKEILAILGVKDGMYEFSVFDTGINFDINVLLKLGLEPITTNGNNGGTGNGFMTTFETMHSTKASLIITEYSSEKESIYSKCVSIRFDKNNQYIIRSHRANEIKAKMTNRSIKVLKQVTN